MRSNASLLVANTLLISVICSATCLAQTFPYSNSTFVNNLPALPSQFEWNYSTSFSYEDPATTIVGDGPLSVSNANITTRPALNRLVTTRLGSVTAAVPGPLTALSNLQFQTTATVSKPMLGTSLLIEEFFIGQQFSFDTQMWLNNCERLDRGDGPQWFCLSDGSGVTPFLGSGLRQGAPVNDIDIDAALYRIGAESQSAIAAALGSEQFEPTMARELGAEITRMGFADVDYYQASATNLAPGESFQIPNDLKSGKLDDVFVLQASISASEPNSEAIQYLSSYTAGDFVVVPEPSTASQIGFGLVGLFFCFLSNRRSGIAKSSRERAQGTKIIETSWATPLLRK